MAATMTANQFWSIPNGTRILNHGYDQCVAVANLWHEGVLGLSFVPVPNARSWWESRWVYSAIYNNYDFIDANAPVRNGDIFVSLGGAYNSVDGHIGVVWGQNADGSFATVEQNAGWGEARWFYRFVRSRANILGFLRPKKGSGGGSATPNPPTPPVAEIEDDDMVIVVGPDGRWFWMDGVGPVEDIATNFFYIKGPTGYPGLKENVEAAKKLASRVVEIKGAENQWIWELARHQATQRYVKRQNAQTAAIVNALKPLFAASTGLDEKKVAALLTEGLKGATVNADISQETIAEIAKQTNDEEDRRNLEGRQK